MGCSMTSRSIDSLQNHLANSVFANRQDRKKAAGRALGTLIEIITFYLLKNWGLENSLAIETRIAEYQNPLITHNVEYSLHPVFEQEIVCIPYNSRSITPTRILAASQSLGNSCPRAGKKSNNLLSTTGTLRNACTIWEDDFRFVNAYLIKIEQNEVKSCLSLMHRLPYAMIECKRVGVEEGVRKGPQTIEKAKQGAYVARMVSSLQRYRRWTGEMGGIQELSNSQHHLGEYKQLLQETIASNNRERLAGLVLTIGVVSNHGNWFTSGRNNKEMEVLAQSYDWLLFLSDEGFSEFLNDLIISPSVAYECVKRTFEESYAPTRSENRFTKVKMGLEANEALEEYFRQNRAAIESWFRVIAPGHKDLNDLRTDLDSLKMKDWLAIRP